MQAELTLAAYVVAGMTSAVTVAFSFPALTSGGSGDMPGISGEAYRIAHARELNYCHSTKVGVDCLCFARTSGMIAAHDAPKRAHTAPISQSALGRNQALRKCS